MIKTDKKTLIYSFFANIKDLLKLSGSKNQSIKPNSLLTIFPTSLIKNEEKVPKFFPNLIWKKPISPIRFKELEKWAYSIRDQLIIASRLCEKHNFSQEIVQAIFLILLLSGLSNALEFIYRLLEQRKEKKNRELSTLRTKQILNFRAGNLNLREILDLINQLIKQEKESDIFVISPFFCPLGPISIVSYLLTCLIINWNLDHLELDAEQETPDQKKKRFEKKFIQITKWLAHYWFFILVPIISMLFYITFKFLMVNPLQHQVRTLKKNLSRTVELLRESLLQKDVLIEEHNKLFGEYNFAMRLLNDCSLNLDQCEKNNLLFETELKQVETKLRAQFIQQYLKNITNFSTNNNTTNNSTTDTT